MAEGCRGQARHRGGSTACQWWPTRAVSGRARHRRWYHALCRICAARAPDEVNQAKRVRAPQAASEPNLSPVSSLKTTTVSPHRLFSIRRAGPQPGLGQLSRRLDAWRPRRSARSTSAPRWPGLIVVERAGLRPSPWPDLGTPTPSSSRRMRQRSPSSRCASCWSDTQSWPNPSRTWSPSCWRPAEASQNVIEGMKRSVITKMGLRDQPVLDQFQDEIFRLRSTAGCCCWVPGTGKRQR